MQKLTTILTVIFAILLGPSCVVDSEDALPDEISAIPDVTITAAIVRFQSDSVTHNNETFDSTVMDALALASRNHVDLQIVESYTLPFPPESADHDYSSMLDEFPLLHPEDAPRVWYYYKGLGRLSADAMNAMDNADLNLDQFDLVILLTDANYQGIAKFSLDSLGRPALILESIVLGGWARGESSYYRQQASDYALTDETLHEVGHYMGLRHACESCSPGGILDVDCCNACPWADDVMSRCRNRPSGTNDSYYNVYQECTLEFVRDSFVPAFKKGLPVTQNDACN